MMNTILRIDLAKACGTTNALLADHGKRAYAIAATALTETIDTVELDFSSLMHASCTFFHELVGELCINFPDVFDDRITVRGLEAKFAFREKYCEAVYLARNPRLFADYRMLINELDSHQ